MKFFLLVLVVGTISVGGTIRETANFYPLRLITVQNCLKFTQQNKFKIAKCDVYFHDSKLYLDRVHREPFKQCLLVMRMISDYTPTIFYRVKGISTLTDQMIDSMVILGGVVQYFVEAIPQLPFFIGPSGSRVGLIKGVEKLYAMVALSAAEEESTGAAYKSEFFRQLNRSQEVTKTDQKLLVLNGWHLKNSAKNIAFPDHMERLFTGIVVWVDPEHSQLIGKNQVLDILEKTKTTLPIYLDMHGSPQFSNAWDREILLTPLLILSSLLIVRTFF